MRAFVNDLILCHGEKPESVVNRIDAVQARIQQGGGSLVNLPFELDRNVTNGSIFLGAEPCRQRCGTPASSR